MWNIYHLLENFINLKSAKEMKVSNNTWAEVWTTHNALKFIYVEHSTSG